MGPNNHPKAWTRFVRAAWLAGIPLQSVLAQATNGTALYWAEREYRKLSLAEQAARLNAQLNGEQP